MTNNYKVFLIEDQVDMAESMKKLLEKWGLSVSICVDFENIIKEFTDQQPHIVLMDINIPTFDGFYWCKKIREVSKVPIIFVSSRDSNMDIVMAINNGGDDYIQKPFDSNVLIAKTQALLRRNYEYKNIETQIMECNGIVLNLNDTTIHYEGNNVELTKNEYKILKVLIENQGRVVSRDSLMRQLWNDDVYVNENTLTVNINRLRKKLEDMGIKELISTKKGMGYIIL